MRPSAARRVLARFERFARDARAVSAVEFALVLPFMMTLFLGGVQISDAVAVGRKVTLASRAVADLTTQYVTITNAQMSQILNASASVMAPYSTANLVIVLSEVSVNASGQASVTWSQSLNGTALTVGQAVTLPTGMAQPSTSVIWGQASYNYTPIYGNILTGPFTISDQIFMMPRLSATVTPTGT